ncbi:MAG: tyrosine--tRNA ligase [Parcubacteria group bacterium]
MTKDGLEELFTRGVGDFIDPDNHFKEKVLKKARGEYSKDIVIKLGVDPSRPDIHLGHAVILRRLRQFQDVGCKVVFLVGDFTAQIGDPTGRSKTRPEIQQAEVAKNAQTYIDQVGKILRTDKESFSWIRNSDWLINITDLNLPDDYQISIDVTVDGKTVKAPISPNSFMGKAVAYEKSRMQIQDLGLKEKVSVITLSGFLWTLRNITHSRLINRDMFQERLKAGEELYMHEMMYPVLQGIDSSVLAEAYGSCDLEIGGTDQTFNMLVGRDIMKANSQEQQAVMALEIIPGTDGVEKMSKSLDNYIAITDTPADMYGKVMSVPDNCIATYFKLATYTPVEEIKEIEDKLSKGKDNPKDIKMRLAREIVSIYHGDKVAQEAEEGFVETFSKGGVPKDIPTVKVEEGTPLVDTLLEQGLVSSKTEFRRLEKEGAIKEIESGVYRIGKHRFLRIETL